MQFKSSFIAALVLGLTAQSSAQVVAEDGSIAYEIEARQDHPAYTNDAKFKAYMMAVHNYYRKQHQVVDLVWSNDRAAASKSHSDKCEYRHSGVRGAGENIAIGFTDSRAVVNAWGLERTKYNYNDPKFSGATGHFTQIVWKGTKQVGCSRKKCSGRWFVVCQYFPQGNINPSSNFAKNVLRQTSGKPGDGYFDPIRRDALPAPAPEAEPEAEAEAMAEAVPIAEPEAEAIDLEKRELTGAPLAPRASAAYKHDANAFMGLFIALFSVGLVQMIL